MQIFYQLFSLYIVFLTFHHDNIGFCDIIHIYHPKFRQSTPLFPLGNIRAQNRAHPYLSPPNIYDVRGDNTLRISPRDHDTDNAPYLSVLPYIPYHTKYLSTNDLENKVRSTKVYVSFSFAVIGRFHFKRFFTVSIATLTTSSNT